jgi:acyl-CoA reductase-like NAD-dependent aldehyde dehydrogenase
VTIVAQKLAGSPIADAMTAARAAQPAWAALPIAERIARLRRMRQIVARDAEAIAATVARPVPETVMAEMLPFLDACRWLEGAAPRLLAPKRLGLSGRPTWLFGVDAEIRREPIGLILIVAPGRKSG